MLLENRKWGSAASAPPRSISHGSRPAGSTAIGSATSSPGTWRLDRFWCARPVASFPIATAATRCSPRAYRRRQRSHPERAAARCRKLAGRGSESDRNLNLIRRFILLAPAQPLFPCHRSVPYCSRPARPALTSQAHGKRTRSAQTVLAPHLPVADAGVRRARRAGRLPAAQADRSGVHGQSRPERGDHRRPDHRHRAVRCAR